MSYVYEPHDDGILLPSSGGQLGTRGDIRLGGYNIDGANGILAFTYLPSAGSDTVVDTADGVLYGNDTSNYINFRDVLMHQMGHSLGLEHTSSTTSNLLMEPALDTSFDGPQLDEVRAVHYFFGDANEKSNGGQGNNSIATATGLGAITPGGTKSIGTAANVPTQAIGVTATDFVSISNLSDTDFYSFTVLSPSLLDTALSPRGGAFNQGAFDQGQPPTVFDANARNDMALTILAPDGVTILAVANSTSAGFTESIADLVLPSAGTYYARITGADNTVQLYELSLSVVPEPYATLLLTLGLMPIVYARRRRLLDRF